MYSCAQGLLLIVSTVGYLAGTISGEGQTASSTTGENLNSQMELGSNDFDLTDKGGAKDNDLSRSETVYAKINDRDYDDVYVPSSGEIENSDGYTDNQNFQDNNSVIEYPYWAGGLNVSEKFRSKFRQSFNFSWPIRDSSSVEEGDIVLGALHMIHERSEEYDCGKLMDQGGIQALEAMLYTLDHVNGEYGHMLIPGVRLGVLAKDDCDTDIFGLEQALDFIRGECKCVLVKKKFLSLNCSLYYLFF